MRKETILAAYAAIGEATPLKTNCGLLCNAACCAVDADGQGGVTLLPASASSWVRSNGAFSRPTRRWTCLS